MVSRPFTRWCSSQERSLELTAMGAVDSVACVSPVAFDSLSCGSAATGATPPLPSEAARPPPPTTTSVERAGSSSSPPPRPWRRVWS